MNFLSYNVPKKPEQEAKKLGINLEDLTIIADHLWAICAYRCCYMSHAESSLEILQFVYFALRNYQNYGQSYHRQSTSLPQTYKKSSEWSSTIIQY